MKKRVKSAQKAKRSMSLTTTMLDKEVAKENPSTTLKFEAYVEHRRKNMEDKKMNEENKCQEEVQRFLKQIRLTQRV